MRGDLYLTDGTTRINLLTGIDGFYLMNWTPSIPPTKQTWRDSPLSDGRKLAMSKWANATETFSMRVAHFTQDDIIFELQELRRLLLAAREYFIGGSDVPVWLEARGNCETNTRYAVVCDWRAETDDDPFHKPFDLDNPVVDGFTLVLERQHWRHLPPGQTECVELSATQAYYNEQINNFVPTESADDCTVDFGGATIVLNNSSLIFGDVGTNYGCGMRFRSVAIPPSAIIQYAYVEMESNQALAGDNVNVVIDGDDTHLPAAFTTFANYIGRPRTTAHTHWDIVDHWALGTHYQTPDIAAVIQEVIGNPGWASGNNIAIFIDDNSSSNNAYRTPVAWDHAAVRYEPHLYVWWFDTTTHMFGRTVTCNDEVYIANKHNQAQLTHIFIADGAVFSVNLLGLALPYDLFPAVPAAGDDLWFGISTAVPDSGPFCSLVFDISIIQTNITTLGWFYDNGGAAALTVRDNTNANGAMTGDAFDTLGVNSVHWEQPSDWLPQTVNGVAGWWIHATAQVVAGGPTPPRQANRHPYTVVTPFVDTTAANVVGDIQALAKFELEGESGDATMLLSQGDILAGLRTYSRGADFTSFLNWSDEQNPTGVTVTVNGGTATFATDVTTPTGRTIDWTTGGAAGEAWLAYITIPTALVDDFTGEFHSFLRVFVNSATASNLLFKLKICAGIYTNIVWQSDLFSPKTVGVFDIVDFHKITLPPLKNDVGDTYKNVILRIDGWALAAVHAHLIDQIQLPTDECFYEARMIPTADLASILTINANWLEYRASEWKLLDVDSTIPRRMLKAEVENVTGYKIVSWQTKNNGPMIYQPNEHQRWWFLQSHPYANYSTKPYDVLSAQSWVVSRYLSMRGKR